MSAKRILPDVTLTDPESWRYVSEGGATIVFSYIGPSDPQFDSTVLRLRKCIKEPPPRAIQKPLDVVQEWERKEEASGRKTATPEPDLHDEEPNDPTIEFQEKVTSRLIPIEHLPRLEPAKVEKAWLVALGQRSEQLRPAERRAKDVIDVARTKGVLATDLVGGDVIAVEIKPKWAFLPNPKHLSDATKPIKTRRCRFCMHAQHKQGSGETVSSGYCPLDLFSGGEMRVRKSISDLWNAWINSNGAVNNLKIFVRGKTIRPNDEAAVEQFAAQLSREGSDLSGLQKAFTEAILPLLLNKPLLHTLGRLQRTLDPIDIEGLSTLWATKKFDASTPSTPVGSTSPEPTIDDWVSFVDAYHKHDSSQEEEDLWYLSLAYLLSATFKDCSVILRVAKDGEGSITAIDLDPKSMNRLYKWEVLDRQIVTTFKDDGGVCVDARTF